MQLFMLFISASYRHVGDKDRDVGVIRQDQSFLSSN